MSARTLIALLAAATLALAGCSSVAKLSGEWAGSFDLLLPNGWSVQDCEGGRLDACVSADGELLGDVELLNGYPLDESQITADPETVLSDLAESFLEHFRLDRAEGCPNFEYVADEIRDVTVGDQPGKRAAFSVVDSDDQVVERVINHFTLQGEHYAIVNTDAYVTEGGCLGPSDYDPSFVPSDLATMEQYLDELVAGMALPPAPTG